jgi:hypothetical protein
MQSVCGVGIVAQLCAAVVLLGTGCGTSDPDIKPGPTQPDGGMPMPMSKKPACEDDPCGLPGQASCCGAKDGAPATKCVDFGTFGSTRCEMACTADSDCTSGCCSNNICSPKEFCGVAGILPEAMCRDADTCDVVNNKDSCISFFEGCVAPLQQQDKATWVAAVERCYAPSTNTCTSLFACLRNLPFCRF